MNEEMRKNLWLQLVYGQAGQGMNALEATQYADAVIAAFDAKFPAAPVVEIAKLAAVPTAPATV